MENTEELMFLRGDKWHFDNPWWSRHLRKSLRCDIE